MPLLRSPGKIIGYTSTKPSVAVLWASTELQLTFWMCTAEKPPCPEVRGTGNLPSKPEQLLIAFLYGNLHPLSLSLLLVTIIFSSPRVHKAQTTPPQATFTLSSSLPAAKPALPSRACTGAGHSGASLSVLHSAGRGLQENSWDSERRSSSKIQKQRWEVAWSWKNQC